MPSNASERQFYLTGHRQRKYQRKRDARVREALAATVGAASVKTTPSATDSGRRRRTSKPRQARYLLIRRSGPTLTITGAIIAAGKRAAEKRVNDPETIVLAASHLPAKVSR